MAAALQAAPHRALHDAVDGFPGELLRIHNQPFGGPWDWERDYVYRDGQLLASVGPKAAGGENTVHSHLDHLGSPRQITDELGAQATFHTYYPFGGEATDPLQDDLELKSTGHNSRLAHEIEHGAQVDRGMIGFHPKSWQQVGP